MNNRIELLDKGFRVVPLEENSMLDNGGATVGELKAAFEKLGTIWRDGANLGVFRIREAECN